MKAGIIIGHLKHEVNEGAMIRTAEAFGLTEIFSIGGDISRSAACGADRHVNFKKFKSIENLLEYIVMNNFSVVAIEDIKDAIEISDVKNYPVNPIFISGHENNGIPEKLLRLAKMTVKIKQGPGYTKCLNTGVAFGIVVHDFYKRIK